MRKSLIIIASALVLAVAAATGDRLRYDSTAFTDVRITGAPAATQVEYPPCVRGVREDRCIQLYERGVRRSYQRWLAAHGRGGERFAAADRPGQRTYRACRGRGDDRCQQRAGERRWRAVRHALAASPARRVRQAERRVAPQAVRRVVTARPAVRRAPVAQPVRTTRVVVPAPRQRPGTGSMMPAPRPGASGTPGI